MRKKKLKYKRITPREEQIIGYYWDYTSNSQLPVFRHSPAWQKARMRAIIRVDEENPYY